MEIGAISGGRYVSTPVEKVQEKQEKPPEKSSENIITDYVKISQEAQDKAKAQRLQGYDKSWIATQLESAKMESEAVKKSLKVVSTCQKITMRVMSGDIVPHEDLQYLMEHDSKGYQLAMAMRRVKPDPEKHDRLTEDEERASGEAAAPVAEAGGVPTGEVAPPEMDAPAAE